MVQLTTHLKLEFSISSRVTNSTVRKTQLRCILDIHDMPTGKVTGMGFRELSALASPSSVAKSQEKPSLIQLLSRLTNVLDMLTTLVRHITDFGTFLEKIASGPGTVVVSD